MSKAYQEAVKAGRAILKDKWQDSNVAMDRQFGITEIRCPGCKQAIARLMPIGPQKVTRVKGRTIIQEQVILGKLTNYREVEFEMTGGSKHVANMCETCAEDAKDPMVAVAIYAANLAQFSAEGVRLSDYMCNRGPVKRLRVAPTITD